MVVKLTREGKKKKEVEARSLRDQEEVTEIDMVPYLNAPSSSSSMVAMEVHADEQKQKIRI
jgi:hypothetical protein